MDNRAQIEKLNKQELWKLWHVTTNSGAKAPRWQNDKKFYTKQCMIDDILDCLEGSMEDAMRKPWLM